MREKTRVRDEKAKGERESERESGRGERGEKGEGRWGRGEGRERHERLEVMANRSH